MNALVRVRFIIFALILMLVSVTFAFAATSVPQDSESRAIFQVTDTATSVVTTTVQSTNTPTATLVVTPTATVTATITITLTPTITPTATPIPTRTPTGTPLPPATNPDSAREPNGAWAYLNPGADPLVQDERHRLAVECVDRCERTARSQYGDLCAGAKRFVRQTDRSRLF